MAEKSALAQENARLQRENTNLQELLSYTMQQGEGSVRAGTAGTRISIGSSCCHSKNNVMQPCLCCNQSRLNV